MKTLYEKMRDNRKRMHFNELKAKIEQQAKECRERDEAFQIAIARAKAQVLAESKN